MRRIISDNFQLKILALLLAIVTWSYIVFELHKVDIMDMKAFHRTLPSPAMTAKPLPLK